MPPPPCRAPERSPHGSSPPMAPVSSPTTTLKPVEDLSPGAHFSASCWPFPLLTSSLRFSRDFRECDYRCIEIPHFTEHRGFAVFSPFKEISNHGSVMFFFFCRRILGWRGSVSRARRAAACVWPLAATWLRVREEGPLLGLPGAV